MRKIKYIGLDMDHTLIRYKTENFESLVYKMAIEYLIENHQYPETIRKFEFIFDEAIRGLVVDSKNGNILKLSRYGAIRQSYHGTKPIHYDEQKEFYRSIYVDLNDPNYMAIDTSFSIAFCVLFSQLVDHKDKNTELLPSYNIIATDVLHSVDRVHALGELKKIIIQNPHDYLIQDEELVQGLKRYIKHGKKFFILTNSDYHYANHLLEYAITPFLNQGEHWYDLFDFVITLAGKPKFFYDAYRFLSVNPIDGTMSNTRGRIKPGIYQGGHATKFTEDLHLLGDEILYIGDHIYGDILRLKKDCNWRTALVVEELGEEIKSQQKAKPIEDEIVAKMAIKRQLEDTAVTLQTKNFEEKKDKYDRELEEIQEKTMELDKKITQLIHRQRKYYNPYWGRVFRTGAEESYFAYQVDRFACIYMEKLTDLLEHSPLTYFRANRRLLAHDLENMQDIEYAVEIND